MVRERVFFRRDASDMTARWTDVRCASIPVEQLSLLADLRGRADGVRVSIADGIAWVYWEPESEQMHAILVRRLMPLPGVRLFTERGGRWYRLGECLPDFGVPVCDGSAGVPLDRIILPTPIQAHRPEGLPAVSLRIRLVRAERSQARPASALRCPLEAIADWAERATSAQLARLQGGWSRGSGHGEGEAEVQVLGTPGSIPLLPDGVRFWGTDLLIPLGFRADPDLSEPALHRALGAGAGDLAVLDHDGFELIARRIFKPISRAGIRLAWEGNKGAGPVGGGRS